MYTPLGYDQINWMEGRNSPSNLKLYNNVAFNYWTRQLYMRMISRIRFTVPETWEGPVKNFFHWCLYSFGFVMISEDDERGYFFQPANPGGYSFYYQPTKMLVGNPLMSKHEFVIGEECEVLQLTPDYTGLMDVVVRYAEKLALLDASIDTNITNSKFAFLFGAKSKAEAEALKALMDKINRGEPAVFYDKALNNRKPGDEEEPFWLKQLQDVTKNYIVPQQLQDSQTLLNAFDAEVGINTVPYQKAERMTQFESESKQEDSHAKIETLQSCLEASLKNIKKLYPDIPLDYEIVQTEVQEPQTPEEGDQNGNS